MIENEEDFNYGFTCGYQTGHVSGFKLEVYGKLDRYNDKQVYSESYREGWRKGYEYGYKNGGLDRTKMESYTAGYSHGYKAGRVSVEGGKYE